MSASGLYPADPGSNPGLPTDCACTPGSSESGWHEQRCQACLDEEMNVWRKMLARFDEYRRL